MPVLGFFDELPIDRPGNDWAALFSIGLCVTRALPSCLLSHPKHTGHRTTGKMAGAHFPLRLLLGGGSQQQASSPLLLTSSSLLSSSTHGSKSIVGGRAGSSISGRPMQGLEGGWLVE